ncbi:MAG: response regulator [Elusimicrobiota bacterium]
MELAQPSEKLILIVDDDESIRDLLEFIIKKEGFKVEKCSNGKEALQKAKELSPDLIILDLMLPGYGGFEILRELQMYDTAHIPIIIITGKYMDRTTSEMIKMEPNVKEFIQKPIKNALLTATIHKILGTKPQINK